MKGALIAAAAAALAGTAVADGIHRRHAAFHERRRGFTAGVPAPEPEPTCGCVTKVVTVTGDPTLVPITESSTPTPSYTPAPSPSDIVTTLYSTEYTTLTVSATGPPEVPVPTVNFPTPGTYTVPATTVTITQETTVCGATSTDLPEGDHTYGGITTVVDAETTITAPYATVKPTGDTVTSVIETTTFVCPSGGTYTIAPSTTSLSTSTVMVYPTPVSYSPGTYTQDEQTVTVTDTDFIYVCPEPTSGPDVPTFEPTPVPEPTVEESVPEPTSVEPEPEPTSKEPKPEPTKSVPSPPVGGEGDKYGITYSVYKDESGAGCKDRSTVMNDILRIKKAGFESVRLYATDCDGLKNVGEACDAHNMKMILGVFIDSAGIPGAQEQVNDIVSWGQWDKVSLIVVGNEALFNGYVDAGSLAGFISSCSQKFKGSGYTGPVTTAETLNIWEDSGAALCSAIDVIGANLHPFFNSEVTASEAGQFVKSQMEITAKICPGKDVITLEAGWPSAGNAHGKAVPGVAEQATAVKSIIDAVGDKSVLFSYSDEKWKDLGEWAVEQSWGCIDAIA